MGLFRRRAPERRQHPDPAVEAQLQRILWLRGTVAGKEDEVAGTRRDIRKADKAVRRDARKYPPDVTLGWRAADLRQRAAVLEAEIRGLYDEIGERIAAVDADDLLWLDPVLVRVL